MNDGAGWQLMAGLSALGFYLFLAVWVAAFLWSRTKEKLAVQETLQRLIQNGTQVSPEIIDALRRTTPKRTQAEIIVRARKFRYWGYFLVGLGTAIALYGLRYSDSPVKDLREMTGSGVVLFVIPGLFCLAHSVITNVTNRSPND
jgi:hypothetical protein